MSPFRDTRPSHGRPPEEPTRVTEGYREPANPAFRGHYGYGEAGYYNMRGDWRIAGPFTGVGPKDYIRSDERIEDEVCHRLTQHGYVDASDVIVSVENGEVTLEGKVDNRQEKRMAEDTAYTVSGVKDVHNNLKLRWRDRKENKEK